MGTKPKAPLKQPQKRQGRARISVLFGWAYIIVALSVIALLLTHSEPEGRMVCDRNTVAAPLTGFGACRVVKP